MTFLTCLIFNSFTKTYRFCWSCLLFQTKGKLFFNCLLFFLIAAITLAEKGYDVWMGNSRGTRYSRDHVNLDPRSAEFWDYRYTLKLYYTLMYVTLTDSLKWLDSWDEMGKYDVPATINYVLRMTGRSKLSYLGYSLGSTTYFIAMITHPELNSKVDMMVCLFIFIILFVIHYSVIVGMMFHFQRQIAIAPFASCAHFPPTIQMAIPMAHTIDVSLSLINVVFIIWFDKIITLNVALFKADWNPRISRPSEYRASFSQICLRALRKANEVLLGNVQYKCATGSEQ